MHEVQLTPIQEVRLKEAGRVDSFTNLVVKGPGKVEGRLS